MEDTVSLQTLKLILKDVATSIASDDEGYLPVHHVVEIFEAVAANLAHNLLKQVMGG